MKNIYIHNRLKISENSDEFLLSFSKKVEDKVLTSHEKVHENAIIQNEKPQRKMKNDIFDQQLQGFLVISIQKQSPRGILQKSSP